MWCNKNTVGTLHITVKRTHMNTVENFMSLTSEKKASNCVTAIEFP